ncbi:unnamed protein product [Hydatigera taeniaeformis]|uniref:Nucleoporin Nup120/160 beta-propeller domain-containing protein n=1 Tax=Hydatigena taeniaeformis TaxID=6205 RepID=A0A3P7EHZ1_HYDTA|nr:unnamed protein product [Hydatigera taeniaeformis]
MPPIQMTYWIWVRLNSCENRIVFDVVRVDPIKQMANPQACFNPGVCSLIDFVPFLSCDKSNASDASMDISLDGVTLPTLNVWSVVDAPNEEECIHSTLQLNKYDSDGSNLSLIPTSPLTGYSHMQLWQEPLPQSIFISEHHFNDELDVSDDTDEKGVDLAAFMDFIFTPGRFAKVAIHNAFKSLKQSHHLPQECPSADNGVAIMKNEISQALISFLRPSLSVPEFQTLLKTFHQIIVDYHQRASEPLGLFCVEANGDVVVVHRSGLSVARRLQPTEEVLLNPSLSNYSHIDSDLGALPPDHRAAKRLARECLVTRCCRIVKGLTQSQVWLEHEHKICENSANFQYTEVILNKLLLSAAMLLNCRAELPANHLFGWEEDGTVEEIYDAFNWFLESLFTSNLFEAIATELEEEVEDGDVTAYKGNCQRPSCLLGFGSSLSAELLRQGVWQTTSTSLRFCVAMHLLWRHWNHHFATSLEYSRIESNLQQIYRCLAFIQWLTTTRTVSPSGPSFLSLAWTHLKILGMADRSMDLTSSKEFLHSSYYSTPTRMRFHLCGLSLFEELILSAPEIFSGVSVGTGLFSWRTHSLTIITALQKLLCPVLKNGETVAPILKHLLLGAQCKELLTLCKCLAPNAFGNIDKKGLPNVLQDDQVDRRPDSVLNNGYWWPGDVNALYICAFLALLWSGLADEAVEQYIQGSLCLRRRLLSHLYPFATGCSPELALSENVAAPCSLLEKLFPAEFALSGSLGDAGVGTA